MRVLCAKAIYGIADVKLDCNNVVSSLLQQVWYATRLLDKSNNFGEIWLMRAPQQPGLLTLITPLIRDELWINGWSYEDSISQVHKKFPLSVRHIAALWLVDETTLAKKSIMQILLERENYSSKKNSTFRYTLNWFDALKTLWNFSKATHEISR